MIYNLIRDIGIKYLRLGLLKLIKLINLTFDLSFKYFFILNKIGYIGVKYL